MLATRERLVILVLQSGQLEDSERFNASNTQEEQKIWQQGVDVGNEKIPRLND